MKENSLKGISRIHSKGAGWLVRLYRNAKVIVKLFSDGIYGDSDKALQAAQAYYRQSQIKFPPIEKPPFRETHFGIILLATTASVRRLAAQRKAKKYHAGM